MRENEQFILYLQKFFSTPVQTSMSVALTMVAVLTTVPTPRALSRAAAEVDSHRQGMEETVMVRPTQLTVFNISTKLGRFKWQPPTV